MYELQAFETGPVRWSRAEKTEISLETVIRDAIATPGRRRDPEVAVNVLINPGETAVMAHADPLKRAVVAVVSWVCGELGRKHRDTMHIRIGDSPEPYRNIVVAETADLTRAAVLPDAPLEPLQRLPGRHLSRLAAGDTNDRRAWRSDLVARGHHWCADRAAVALMGLGRR
jgi:hypothetical protein